MLERQTHFMHVCWRLFLMVVILSSREVRRSYGYEVDVVSVQVVEGEPGVIPCRVRGMVSVVLWRKVSASPNELLVILEQNGDPGEKSGQGYEAGLFNITDDFSLVINEVKPDHAGQYVCEIADYSTASIHHSAANVSVQARALTEGPSSSLPLESTRTVGILPTVYTPKAYSEEPTSFCSQSYVLPILYGFCFGVFVVVVPHALYCLLRRLKKGNRSEQNSRKEGRVGDIEVADGQNAAAFYQDSQQCHDVAVVEIKDGQIIT